MVSLPNQENEEYIGSGYNASFFKGTNKNIQNLFFISNQEDS
jgi:hypothetical protein